MHKKITILTLVFIFVLVFIVAVFNVFFHKTNNLVEPITIEIPKGSSGNKIAELLSINNIIPNKLYFKIATKLTLQEKQLKAGEYTFTPKMSLQDVISKITKGEITQYFITFPEGWTVAQVSEKLENEKSLTGSISFLEEGTLLPQTYAYTKGAKRMDIIHDMQNAMDKTLNKVWSNRVKNDWIKTKKDLVNLASIVEKETSLIEEMPHVASVYLNRLRKKMRLQADPTVIYGIKSFDGNITRANLKEDHPYNTYTRHGLPLGAIANPSVSAIKAVAMPSITNDLYFVANGKGGHVFAKTLQQHKKNVKNYLKIYRSQNK